MRKGVEKPLGTGWFDVSALSRSVYLLNYAISVRAAP